MLQLTTIIFLVCFSMLAVIHRIALELFLYWHFHWFDIFMHFFGGAVVALGIFTLADLKLLKKSSLTCSVVMLGVFCIACIWEAFEVFAGIPIESDYFLDTASDLIVGSVGGYVGYRVARSIARL